MIVYLTSHELGSMGVDVDASMLPALDRANLDIYRKLGLSQDAFDRLSAEDKKLIKMATMDQTLFLDMNGIEESINPSRSETFKIGNYSEGDNIKMGARKDSGYADTVEDWLRFLSFRHSQRYATLAPVDWYGDL